MEEAITQWLPSVSQPGDTVIIFFAGHGDVVIDKKTNQARLTYLLPHEFAGTAMAGELLTREKNHTITEDETALLRKWKG